MPIRGKILAGAVGFAVSFAVGACGAGSMPPSHPHARQIACVGTMSISTLQLDEWDAILSRMSQEVRRDLVPPLARRRSLRTQALAFLTASARTVAAARAIGTHPTSAQLRGRLRLLEYERATGFQEPDRLLEHLEASATPRAARLLAVEIRLSEQAVSKWVKSLAERLVSPMRVASYYRTHMRTFIVPERRDVAVIETFQKAKIERAKHEIEAGSDFLQVMRQRNDEPAVGGLKLGMRRDHLGHPYEQDYFTARPHVLVGPRAYQIYYMFEVRSIKPPVQQSLRQAEPSIRRTLAAGSPVLSAMRALEARVPTHPACRNPLSV